MKKQIYTHPYFLAGIVPTLFFLVLYFYPLAGIFAKSFFPQGALDLSFLDQVFGSPRMMKVIWFTTWQAAVSTLLTLACALPAAFVMANFEFRFKKTLSTLAAIPFVLPAVVVAAALESCFGKTGWMGEIRHPLVLIFLAHLFYNFSVMLRIITGFWTSLQGDIREAASMLGATPAQAFFYVTLPLLRLAIMAGTVLVFIFCFSSFGIILILGGPGYATIEAEIYRQAAHLFNLPLASFLSLVQIAVTFALMGVYTKFSKTAARFTPRAGEIRLRRPERLWEKIMVSATALFIILVCVMPLLSLAAASLVHNGELSLAYYRAIFENSTDSVFYVPPVQAVQYSFTFALGALAVALVTGVCAALFITHTDRRHSRLTTFSTPCSCCPCPPRP